MAIIDPNMLLKPEVQGLASVNSQENIVQSLLNEPQQQPYSARRVPGQKATTLQVIGAALQDLVTGGVGGVRLGTPQALNNLQQQTLQAQQQQLAIDRDTEIRNAQLRQQTQDRMDNLKLRLEQIKSDRQKLLADLGLRGQERKDRQQMFKAQRAGKEQDIAAQHRNRLAEIKAQGDEVRKNAEARRNVEDSLLEFGTEFSNTKIEPAIAQITPIVQELAEKAKRGDFKSEEQARALIWSTVDGLRTRLASYGAINPRVEELIKHMIDQSEMSLSALLPAMEEPKVAPAKQKRGEINPDLQQFFNESGLKAGYDAATGLGKAIGRLGNQPTRTYEPSKNQIPPEAAVQTIDQFIEGFLNYENQ